MRKTSILSPSGGLPSCVGKNGNGWGWIPKMLYFWRAVPGVTFFFAHPCFGAPVALSAFGNCAIRPMVRTMRR